MAGFDNDVMYASNVDFRGVEPVVGQFTANGQLLIGSTASPFARVSLPTINANGNLGFGAGTLTINPYNTAKWIVDPTSNIGTHTTITSALTAASAGETIFIRPGTYTENLTLKAGVNLAAFEGDQTTPNVTIVGTLTFTVAGTVSIGNIRLQTNSSFFLAVTGSAASVVNLNDCFLNCTNNTGISFTSSSGSSQIRIVNSRGDIGTTGISLFASSASGSLVTTNCVFGNSGGTSTASTLSAGGLNSSGTQFLFPITSSGTASLGLSSGTIISSMAQNVTALTVGGSGANTATQSAFLSGTASAISIGNTISITAAQCHLVSSNANTVTGLGTILYSLLTQDAVPGAINAAVNTGEVVNTGPLRSTSISFDGGVNSLSNYTEGTFTPTLTGGSVAGTTTYTSQNGYYTRVGNLVTCIGSIIITAATGTGNARIGDLPFTIKNQTNGIPMGSCGIQAAGWVWPVGGTSAALYGSINSTNALILISGTAFTGNFLQMANAALTLNFTVTYQI